MKTLKFIFGSLMAISLLATQACNKDKDNNDDDPPVNTTTVVVNEVMTKDTLGIYYVDGQGDGSDWAEFYNTTDADIDIAGYYVTDKGENAADDDLWQIPTAKGGATMVKAKSFLVVVFGASDANGVDIEGIVNDTIFCPSGLSTSKDEAVALFDASKKFISASEDFTANGPLGELPKGKSLGRETDGAATWKIFDVATPNASNN